MYETALGRLVPANEPRAVLEDSSLRLLFNLRRNPQNPNNVHMRLATIADAVTTDSRFVVGALGLMALSPAFVEEGPTVQQDRTFRMSEAGARFVRNLTVHGLGSSP